MSRLTLVVLTIAGCSSAKTVRELEGTRCITHRSWRTCPRASTSEAEEEGDHGPAVLHLSGV